jgi:alkaline phosphatase D
MCSSIPPILPIFLIVASLAGASNASSAEAASFQSDWDGFTRPWTGPHYWAGPLQDWRLANDRAECFVSGGNRLLFLTTHHAEGENPAYQAGVRLGRITPAKANSRETGWAGFRIGIKGTLPDYRNAAIFGKGFEAGIRTDGTLFAGKKSSDEQLDPSSEFTLDLKVTGGQVTLTATDAGGAKASVKSPITSEAAQGHFALVCHRQAPAGKAGKRGGGTHRGGDVRFWFDDWKLSGKSIIANPDRAWGPVLWTQHTLSRGVMKLTAQMAPIGKDEPQSVTLACADKTHTAPIDPLSRTATFRIENWDDTKDVPFTAVYTCGRGKEHTSTGIIRRDPVDKETIVVAGFTGNTDYIFPDSKIVGNVTKQNPDVLFFSGDQLYESVAGYGIQRTWDTPVETVALDYLRKWYLVGWAWKDLLKDRPSLFFPDDHDVYQGNIWGAGGIASKKRGGFDDGGYGMDATWVNAVQRTQCAHMPDPFDPTPIKQGITVYYGDMNYGRVSFAMIEDRKFKTGPATALPDKPGRSDHISPKNVDQKTWDPRSVDVEGAVLLGERQLKFLDHWAADWANSDFKCVLSQTIFCNLANYHGGGKTYLVADLDSNGWPQTGRNKALRAMRKGFAFHYAGDQHLPSIVHHGVDTWNDAGYSFCVPSISAGYPRSWQPDEEGRPVRNRPAPGLPNTGEYRDGLGNHVTVHAIGNPEAKNRNDTPETLGHDKASGHGIVRFNKKTREITIECWRLLVDVNNPKPADQFPGWPKTIKLEDNYGRQPVAHLPALRISGIDRPVVQVINEKTGETEYTLRIGSNEFRPKVFAKGPHTVIVGEPSENRVTTLKSLKPTPDGVLEVEVE